MIIALTMLLWAASADAQSPQTIPIGEPIEWSAEEQPRGATFRSGDVTLAFRPQVDAEMPELIRPVLTVTAPGFPPVSIQGEATGPLFDHQASVGRWDAAGTPFVLFQSFSGGAHCCTSMTVIYPESGQLRLVELGSWDGGYLATPVDVNGDGRVDFVNRDNAFLYAFTNYAQSLAPPIIHNVIDGRVEEVSNHGDFRRMFEEAAREARQVCLGNETGRNGACAAYVAAAARIGRFEEAWIEMLRHHEQDSDWDLTGCRMPLGPNGCPPGQSFEQSFPQALHSLLRERGYISPTG